MGVGLRRSAMARTSAGILAALLLTACASSSPGTARNGSLPDRLRDGVQVESIMADLGTLQQIADDRGGMRAAGSSGGRASTSFVADAMRRLGYDVRLDTFDVPLFSEAGGGALQVVGAGQPSFVAGTDFRAMLFSPSGELTARVVAVGFDPAAAPGARSGLGCVPGDFASQPRGVILLVQPGPCLRRTQVDNAQQAGAAAIVVSYPEWDPGFVLRPTLLDPSGVRIPVIGTTRQVGLALAAAASRGAQVHLRISTAIVDQETVNIFAETREGDAGHVLMVGGHLDTAIDGPGVNDNGSGTMALLEIARRLAAAGPTAWKVRFAFWSGEEIGLWGSRRYVDGLSDAERGTIQAYLNFDMLASPNGARLIYDDADAAPRSDAIVGLFADYFAGAGLASTRMALSGASDHYFFEQANVPTGGLFAGANEVKDAAAAATFGGTAGEDYDSCYPRSCDRLDRINTKLVDELARAAAFVIGRLADGEVDLGR
jgi:Zn-dependent M28 family amino/carboxypeptidase